MYTGNQEGASFHFIYSFILGCAGSLLLCELFSSCREEGLLFSRERASPLVEPMPRAPAQQLWGTSLVALWRMDSSRSRD